MFLFFVLGLAAARGNIDVACRTCYRHHGGANTVPIPSHAQLASARRRQTVPQAVLRTHGYGRLPDGLNPVQPRRIINLQCAVFADGGRCGGPSNA